MAAPAAVPFSYAQAAKSKPSQSNPSTSSPTANPASQQAKKDATSNGADESGNATPAAAAAIVASTSNPNSNAKQHLTSAQNGHSAVTDNSPNGPQATSSNMTLASDSQAPAGQIHETMSSSPVPASFSPQNNTGMSTAKNESKTPEHVNTAENAWDNKSQSSNTTPSSFETSEKGDGTKEKAKEAQQEGEPTKPLKEAPPPAVNVWLQRAQDAKTRQPPSTATSNQAKPAVAAAAEVAKTNSKTLSSSSSSSRENSTNSVHGSGFASHLNGKVQNLNGPGGNRREPTAARTVNVKDVDATSPPTSSQTTSAPSSRRFNKSDTAGPRSATLAPARDSSAWPTPETVQDEDRRKAQEKAGKTDVSGASKQPHGKNEWVQVPFTPSVKFNTPMPQTSRRGGRGGMRGDRGGGRDTGPRRGSISERGPHAGDAFVQNDTDATLRGRKTSATHASSDHLNRSRRPASASQASSRGTNRQEHVEAKRPSLPIDAATAAEVAVSSASSQRTGRSGGGYERSSNRRNISAAAYERPEDAPVNNSKVLESSIDADSQRDLITSSKIDESSEDLTSNRVSNQQSSTQQSANSTSASSAHTEGQLKHRSPADYANIQDAKLANAALDSRSESAYSRTPSEWSREQAGSVPQGSLRERADARFERGSGRGKSSRGGHFSASQQHHHHHHHHQAHHTGGQGHLANGSFQNIHSASTNLTRSPSLQSPPYLNTTSSNSSSNRAFRNGPRSASIPGEAYGRFPLIAYPAGPQYMPYQQYPNAMYDYGGEVILSPYPYGTYYDPNQTVIDVATQLEYYFTKDNLIKDTYLRSHMDSQGFVALSFVANFQRMKTLSTDLELIKHASTLTPTVKLELRMGNDGKERIRRRDDWEQWVMNMSDRNPSAQNEGPSQTEQQAPAPISFPYIHAMHNNLHFPQQSPISPSNMFSQMPPANGMPAQYNGAPFVPVRVSSPAGQQQSASTTPIPQQQSFPPPQQATSHQPYSSSRHSIPVIDRSAILTSGQRTSPLLSNGSQSEKLGGGDDVSFITNNNNISHPHSQEADSFKDEQVESLTVVARPVNSSSNSSSKASLTQNPDTLRAISNGSNDSRAVASNDDGGHKASAVGDDEREPRSLARQPLEQQQALSTSNGSIERDGSHSSDSGSINKISSQPQPQHYYNHHHQQQQQQQQQQQRLLHRAHILSPTQNDGNSKTISSFSHSMSSIAQSTEADKSTSSVSPTLRTQSSDDVHDNEDDDIALFWIREKERESLSPLPRGSNHEPYLALRSKALEQRRLAALGHCPYDLDVLYHFWSHFLVRNFNTNMYNEFRQLAHEDLYSQQSDVGMNNLIKYYGEALENRQEVIRNRVARHYVKLVNSLLSSVDAAEVEAGTEQQEEKRRENVRKMRTHAFDQLRSQWRNGALYMKNRKRISDYVDSKLKAALDR